MSTIIIPGRWKRQPTGNVVVSNASPVSLGITQAFPLIGNGQNAVKGGSEQIVLGSGGSYSQDSRGIYLSGSGSGQGGSVAVNLSSYGTLTLSWWMWWNTFANDYDMALEYTADGLLNDGFWISPNSGGGTQKFEIAVGAGPSGREFARPSAGAWHHYMARMRRGATAADIALSVDGVPISGTNTGTTNTGALFANSTLNILGRNSASLFAAARMQNIILRAGYYAPDWLAAEEYAAPWAMYEKHARILYFPSAGGGGATLTADAGTYALTGTAATLKADRKLAADSGSYAITGTDVSLKLGRKLTAESGTYTVNGTDVSLTAGRKLAADSGTYSLTGTDVTLTYQPAGGYTLAADSGSYTLTGTAATLKASRKLTADSGTYALTGTDVTLTRGFKITADSGTYTVTGSNVAFARTYRLPADSGSYTLSGSPVSLSWSGEVVPVAPTHGGPSIYGKAVFREAEFKREYEREVSRIEAERFRARQMREDEELVIIMAALAA